jgi:4-hydroxymandelate synthase
MTAQGVDYIELYAAELEGAVDYLVGSLGLAVVARAQETHRRSVLLRQADVRLVVTSGAGTEEFLAEHGDGIADIALTCVDPKASYRAALRHGARSYATMVVSAFGDVRHTLSPARPTTTERLAGRPWIPVPATATGRPELIRRLDHLAVCVPAGTLQATADFYCDAFGLERYYSEYVQVGDQAMDSVVVRSRSGRVTFTMLEPDSRRLPGQIDGFLERNAGAGVQHVAFGVDDIVTAVRTLRTAGVQFLATPGAYYDALAERMSGIEAMIADLRDTSVLADCDEWGYLLQIFTRSPYPRNTLFFEAIQRNGAQGFGSANIRALYEAVERERLLAG